MKGKTAMTATERSRQHRKRQKAEGYTLIQVSLMPDTAAYLDTLVEQFGKTKQQIINSAIKSYCAEV